MSHIDPYNLSGDGRYVLEVRGSSMIDIGITDGDFVVIQQQATAKNGDIIVALVNREEATLKIFHQQPDGRIELRPANSTMQSEFYQSSQILIQGKMVGLFRKY